MNLDTIIFITILLIASAFCIRALIKNLQQVFSKKPCASICDFCKHFDFNGNAEGVYVGNGYCRFKSTPKEPSDGSKCTHFKCFCKKSKGKS